jgi:hypothetical protein
MLGARMRTRLSQWMTEQAARAGAPPTGISGATWDRLGVLCRAHDRSLRQPRRRRRRRRAASSRGMLASAA